MSVDGWNWRVYDEAMQELEMLQQKISMLRQGLVSLQIAADKRQETASVLRQLQEAEATEKGQE